MSTQIHKFLFNPLAFVGRHFIGRCLLGLSLLGLAFAQMQPELVNPAAMSRPVAVEDQRPVIRSGVSLTSPATQFGGALGLGMDMQTGLPRQTFDARLIELKPLGLNEFQKFVWESSGLFLPLFGVDFFANSQLAGNPFAPLVNPCSDYLHSNDLIQNEINFKVIVINANACN
jgi:hypothetical protein